MFFEEAIDGMTHALARVTFWSLMRGMGRNDDSVI